MSNYFTHYNQWDDYKNGMYKNRINDEFIIKAAQLLINVSIFKNTMKQVVNKWNVSTMVNLNNKSINRVAWIGQASCNLLEGCTEQETKAAWKGLSKDEKFKANEAAREFIFDWEQSQMGNYELF